MAIHLNLCDCSEATLPHIFVALFSVTNIDKCGKNIHGICHFPPILWTVVFQVEHANLG